jgi:hypothetical protein
VKDKSAFKRNRTTPSRNALCVRLAAGNHLAGFFLVSILHWAKYGRAEIPGVEGEWVANPRSWWRHECCLSSSQYDRSIAKLKKLGLIEARQWWWGYTNILHLRPTKVTLDYIVSATTWVAAEQFLPDQHVVEIDDPSSLALTICKENADDGNLGSTKLPISKDISNLSDNQTSNPQSAVPASPTCANGKKNNKKSPGKNKDSKDATSIVSLKELENIWVARVAKKCSGKGVFNSAVPELSAKGRGALALVETYFAELADQKLTIAHGKYQSALEHFLCYVIDQWSSIGADQQPVQPDLGFMAARIGPFVEAWLEATFGDEKDVELTGYQS